MRQTFINPVHMPIMSETYLRRDFNFALYLGYCYGKALSKFFKWSLFSVLIFFGLVVLTTLIFELLLDEMIFMMAQFVFVLTAFVILLFMRSCLLQGVEKVKPSIVDADGIVASPNIMDIDFNGKFVEPFDRAASLPRMNYLDE